MVNSLGVLYLGDTFIPDNIVPPGGKIHFPVRSRQNFQTRRLPRKTFQKPPQKPPQQAPAKRKNKKRGIFRGLASALGTLAGAATGGAWGGVPGAALGAYIGGDVTRSLGKASGRGDYAIAGSPGTALVGRGHRKPAFYGDSIIEHREFICDIVGSTDFNVTAFPLNPGLHGTFPWLAGVAAQYEKYEFLGLIFEFVSSSSAVGTGNTPALGTVSMATNYDARDANFVSKQQIESYEFSISGAPCVDLVHMVECKPGSMAREGNYIRTETMLETVDEAGIQLYDVGKFQIATQGMQSAYTIGELYVTYKVKLVRPRVVLTVGGLTQVAKWGSPPDSQDSGCEPDAMFPNPTSYFDNLNTPGEQVVSFPENTSSMLFSQAGRYYVVIHWAELTGGITLSLNAQSHTDPTNVVISDYSDFEQAEGGKVKASMSFVVNVSKSGTTTSNMIDIIAAVSTGTLANGIWRARIYESPI